MSREKHTETYIHGYDSTMAKSMVHRNAATDASFLLPHLKAGMSLLDCGCGPGSITADLAAVVSPARVVGVDIEESQLERARAHMMERGLSNVTFMTGTIYDLPFEDREFDVVFSNALLEHLRKPVDALREMWRVTKHEGLAAVRCPDFSGELMWPLPGNLSKLLSVYYRYREVSGGDPFVGKKLRGYLEEAGFSDTQLWATYETSGSSGAIDAIWELGASELITNVDFRKQAVDQEWMTPSEFEAAAAAYDQWRQHPGAIYAHTMCAVLGWKR